MKYHIIIACFAFLLTACGQEKSSSDAYGNFEAKELIVSAEANGKIMELKIAEGQVLAAGAVVGYIDSLQLQLKKKQLQASIFAILSKRQDISSQQKVYDEQRKNLLREKERLEKLLLDGAATSKQMDDLNGKLELLDRQMYAHITSLKTANKGITSEVAPLSRQIEQIDDQIKKSQIVNPISGSVLTTFVEEQEITSFGRPLYSIANTDEMTLRVYISGSQLGAVKIGDEVEIWVDEDAKNNRKLSGTITWVADRAEFTPKIIQTKEARVNMVYAVKIKVKNDGSLKIGMPGEVSFAKPPQTASTTTETN